MNKYLFGPVLSRRLGVSLGIDLLPYKTCSFDCVYCECGGTTEFTLEQQEFFPLQAIQAELKEFLEKRPLLDYITFSGSGEPLLYSRIGEIITFLKTEYPAYKVALLTNSSLLTREDVRRAIREVDLCIPSLDSATQQGFERIDRPGSGLNIKISDIIEGIRQTRLSLQGQMWIEIFIVPGVNDLPEELNALRKAVDYIRPHKVQVNSLDRPGTELWVRKPVQEKKQEIDKYLHADILGVKGKKYREFNKKRYIPSNTMKAAIVKKLSQQPLSAIELSRSLEIPVDDLNKILAMLVAKKAIIKNNETGIFEIPGQGC